MTTAPRVIPAAITDSCVMWPLPPDEMAGTVTLTTDQPEISDRPRRAARRGVAQQEKEYPKTGGRVFAQPATVENWSRRDA